MSQIHVLSNNQSLRILITQNRASCGLGLTYNIAAAHVVEETVVNARRVPSIDALCTAERVISDERVAATVIGRGIVVSAIVVFLRPV